MDTPLVAMQKLGQSPWHDNITRALLTSGALAKMIADGDITGLTSNPTIFEHAISKSSDYDEQLGKAAKAGKNAEKIFDELAVDDIRNAAVAFRPVFDRTHGDDGYVSIEVNPRLAHDTARTVNEAVRLWKTVDQPNLMVKIPATKEGVPAIADCISQGLNINVTLIFSLQRYEEVMDAYIAGLGRRAKAGKDLKTIASVASFFVSRVDTAIDKMLDEKIQSKPTHKVSLEQLYGKAAIANAKLAYQMFKKKFARPTAAKLLEQGARRQRPLWASTSTKNPRYPDVYYVEALIGADTVDTMPPATITAYKDHGKPAARIEEDVKGAEDVLAKLAAQGVDMKAVTQKLEDDGVASFTQSFESLLTAVANRAQAFR